MYRFWFRRSDTQPIAAVDVMRDSISFYLNGRRKTLKHFSPTQTLLRYLREEEGLCGTKEGCAEGDCGACTVMIARLDENGEVRREAINACIRFLPSLEGTSITTVDALSKDASYPHAVQRAMIDSHASQCGFCTPGFVMSLYTAYRNRADLSLSNANDMLAGNLCRCTGYGPILAAAEKVGEDAASDNQSAEDEEERTQLRALASTEPININHSDAESFIPATSDQLAALYARHDDAVIVAGATDVGLWVTKNHRTLPKTIFIQRIDELKAIRRDKDWLTIGAGLSYSDIIELLDDLYPDFGELIRRIGAVQVRNAGTIGGNIANGSPIGDMPPALIVLGAKLVLRKGARSREIALEDFFIEYGKQDRSPGEFVEAVRIPLDTPRDRLRCYKISKRFDQDISALCGCFNIAVEDGVVQFARIAFGGMAGVPKRAVHVEDALVGAAWAETTIKLAAGKFSQDYAPLTDMRASAAYRLSVAENLLLKYFTETNAPLAQTRLVGHGSAF